MTQTDPRNAHDVLGCDVVEDAVGTFSETESSSSESAQTSSSSAAADVDSASPLLTSSTRKSVSFRDIHINEYNMMLGDHPSVSAGAPLTIEWKPVASHRLSLDDYESAFQGERRRGQELRLPASIRKNILEGFVSEEEIKKAKREVNKIQYQRNMTRALEELDSVTALFQSAGRKYKKWRRHRNGAELEPAERWIQEYKQNAAKQQQEDGGPFASSSRRVQSWHGTSSPEAIEELGEKPEATPTTLRHSTSMAELHRAA